jgi:hypothetical protein
MHGAEVARTRVDDMIREAESYRRARGTRIGRAGELRGKARKVVQAVASAALWPIRQ